MNCYKCGATENLSLKKKYPNGRKMMICKPCRNTDARNYVPKVKEEWNENDEWVTKALSTYSRLSEKYR